jgi:DNA adenine methylase
MTAQPCLKWPGGKRHLLPEILPRLPKKIKTYYEPFVGGGAVFFALAAERRFERAMLGDTNQELMSTYLSLKFDVDAVIRRLEEHVYTKTHYYATRAHAPRTAVARAARMIYLNRTCFNGLYRVNKSGKFNVPFGRYTNPTICDEENLRAVSVALHNVAFSLLDFEQTVMVARRGDTVYFDPPYVPVSETSNFTAYGKDGFGPEDQIRLRDTAESLIRRGVHVLLSNSDTPFVRQLYGRRRTGRELSTFFKIEKVRAPRRINSKGGKRGDVGELLISGRKT